MAQIILKTISKQTKDKNVIRGSQHRFMKGKSCLTTLCGKMIGLVDEGRTVDVISTVVRLSVLPSITSI